MEPFETKIDHFVGRNLHQWQLSLSKPKFSDPLSLFHKKTDWKKREIKFDTKILFF
jgi:hypothetical protein